MALDPALIVRWPAGLLPVTCFLAALLMLDSYKLVRLRTVVFLIAAGGIAAGVGYLVNLVAIGALQWDLTPYSRYVAPLVEELAKGAIIVALLRAHRIGFLVDAAICGFAVGTGFALVENLYYLQLLPGADIGVWILRGFGTAIMHGGATAIFAIVALALVERRGSATLATFLPGLAIAVLLHSAFNHFFGSPVVSTVGILLVLPPLIAFVFRRSERAVEAWLGPGFDADTELLELINSGAFSGSPVGNYLQALRQTFRGEVVADLLCYLRLHVELGLRAKGVLMLHEEGLEVSIDEATRAKFDELRYLERSIGPTALLAIKPFRHLRRKELWQLFLLDR
jgi:RsiW-degrading membrane proteinase PrsW (M82 family)